jgi:hypothetical protein
MPFEKGHQCIGGRKKGVPNATTRVSKELDRSASRRSAALLEVGPVAISPPGLGRGSSSTSSPLWRLLSGWICALVLN